MNIKINRRAVLLQYYIYLIYVYLDICIHVHLNIYKYIHSKHVCKLCPQAIVSVERINKFLEMDELDVGVVQQDASMEGM